jgi:hypothetical protein
MQRIAAMLALLLAFGTAPAEGFRSGGVSFDTGPVPDFVDDLAPIGQWPADAPGARDEQWRFWRYDRQVDHRNGEMVAYTDYIYEPRSQGNMADAGRFEISFNPDYQHLTLHRVELRRNGAWQPRLKPGEITIARRERQFEQDISDGQVAALIVIEDVRPEDVVRISYTVTGSNPILAGQHSDQTSLGFAHPILDLRLRALYPPGTQIKVYRENGAEAPVVSNAPDAAIVEARASRVARILDEGDYPVWYQPYPQVQFAPRRSWADVVQWALPLYPDQSGQVLPEDLERRLTDWAKLADPQARLQAALRSVQDDIRYFGVETGTSSHRPRPPQQVWSMRYGDCKDKSWLLVTLLKRLGIAATPALVNTGRGRGILGYAPSADVFDHVIVRATIAGKAVFVDPTMRLQGGSPDRGDLSGYGYVLPVAPGQDHLVEVPPPAGDVAGILTREHYVADGSEHGLRLDVTTEYSGASADQVRRSLDEERLEDRARRYAEYYGKRFGDVEPLQSLSIQDDRGRNVIRVSEAYRLADPWQQEEDMRGLDVEAEALSAVAALPDRSERTGPLYVARPGHYVHEVGIEAPKGWVARFSRESEHVSSSAFDYERTLEPSANGALLHQEMDIRKRELALADVPEHIRALRKVGDGLHSRLRYRAPASADAAEREARLRSLLQDAMEGK